MRLKIIAFSNYHYREVALNWVKHVERLGIENYEIICTDIAGYRYLRKRGVKAKSEWARFRRYDFKRYGIKEGVSAYVKAAIQRLFAYRDKPGRGAKQEHSKAGEHDERTGPVEYRRWLTIWRLVYIKHLLEKGNDVIASDVDAIWLKNPVKDLFADNSEDIVAHRAFNHPLEFKQKYGYVPCMGWAGFKSNPKVIAYLDRVLFEAGKQKEKSDQRSFSSFLMSRNPDVRKSDLGNVFIADDLRILILRKELVRRGKHISPETYVWHPYVAGQEPEAKKQALGDKWLV